MSDRGWIEPIVERVVGQVLESHTAQLRTEIVRRVMEEIAAKPENSAAPSPSTAADLARAVSEIQVGTSQKEILRALLDSSSRYAARVALFVVKGTHAAGWQARGFRSNDGLKDFALDCNARAVVRALADRVAAGVRTAEFDAHFIDQFGGPASGEARLLPLILKDKVAALVYADAGADGALLDSGSLDVLVLATSAWLEVNTLRKQAHKEPSAASGDGHGMPTAASAPAFNDPFAAHAPAYVMAAAASGDSQTAAAVDQPVVAQAQSAVAEVQSAAAVGPGIAAEPLTVGNVQPAAEASAPASTLSPADQEVYRKAQRFARLLVDEIKLYNQAKVSEGRRNKDLYDRLKDTIDKSRATYQKRYGNTVAASANYFEDEVKRSLAEDDLKIMGPNFWK
jgi:hypothetical protein